MNTYIMNVHQPVAAPEIQKKAAGGRYWRWGRGRACVVRFVQAAYGGVAGVHWETPHGVKEVRVVERRLMTAIRPRSRQAHDDATHC